MRTTPYYPPSAFVNPKKGLRVQGYDIFYRVFTGFRNPAKNALQIVEYEEQELGNRNVIYPLIDRAKLATVPIGYCRWMTLYKQDALRYGSRRNVETIFLRHYCYQIIGEDGDGGYLIVTNMGEEQS